MRLRGMMFGLLLAMSAVAHAQQDTWASRGQVGFAKSTGNTDSTNANVLFHAAHLAGDWKYLFALEALYGATKGQTTAQAWSAHLQANYNLTERLYWYGAARYDDDRFSGFAYQETLSTGVGYQLIKTDATKLTAQAGVGVRRLRPEILLKNDAGAIIGRTELATSNNAVLDAALNLEHAFNEATKLLASASLESGKDNTLTKAGVALQVKMATTLALSAGVQMTHNSKPPAGAKNTDTLSTLNLVYEIKNAKLAAE